MPLKVKVDSEHAVIKHWTWASLVSSAGKESTCNAGDLGWKDPLEKGKAPSPVFWSGECHGLLESMGSQRVRRD